jgi:hypothetical protein
MFAPKLTGSSLGSNTPVNRICFRGDLRPPNEAYRVDMDVHSGRDPILDEDAFEPRNPGPGPSYRQPDRRKVGDADPESGVCVTPRFAMAPLFPIQNFPWTWIYVVYIESAYNTKMRQVLDSQTIIKDIQHGSLMTNVVRYASLGCIDMRPTVDVQEATNIMWALYGDELIVDRLPTRNIIAAIKCKRNHINLKQNYKDGIQYELVPPIVPNFNCGLDHSIYLMGLGFLSDELTLHPIGTTPTIQTGFHESVKT